MSAPFVVLVDEAPEVVRQRAGQTVRWAVDRLKQDYFKSDPREIIDIWLFRKRVLDEKDMEAFRSKWEKFVLGLRGS